MKLDTKPYVKVHDQINVISLFLIPQSILQSCGSFGLMVLSRSLALLSSSTTTGTQENIYLPKSNGDKENMTQIMS